MLDSNIKLTQLNQRAVCSLISRSQSWKLNEQESFAQFIYLSVCPSIYLLAIFFKNCSQCLSVYNFRTRKCAFKYIYIYICETQTLKRETSLWRVYLLSRGFVAAFPLVRIARETTSNKLEAVGLLNDESDSGIQDLSTMYSLPSPVSMRGSFSSSLSLSLSLKLDKL